MRSKKLFLIFIFAAQQFLAQVKKYPLVDIPGTEQRTIFSKINDQEYKLFINFPGNYSDESKTFPVIYLLDAQWDFTLLQAIYGEQYYDGFIPAAVIVGITWGGKNPDADKLRARDFTPTDIYKNKMTGNADKFLEFIKTELIPFVEKNYRVSKNDRTLIGSSLGGLFTLYTVFTQHEVFNKYVLTSPAVPWDNGVLYKIEEKYFLNSNELPIKLAMCAGSIEDLYPPFEDFLKKLEDREYQGLELYTKVIDGIGHSGSKAEGYTRGLQFVFAKPEIELPIETLEDYVGEYNSDNNIKVKISIDGNSLVAEYQNNNPLKLTAESKDYFFVKGQFANISFQRDNENQVVGFELELFSSKSLFNKIQ